MENIDLIGVDYLWKVVTNCNEDIAAHAIDLLKEVNTNLAPRLQANPLEFHQTFVAECLERLRAHFDTVSILSKPSMTEDDVIERNIEDTKMIRVMKVLYEYLGECDASFSGDRSLLPLHRYVFLYIIYEKALNIYLIYPLQSMPRKTYNCNCSSNKC